MPAIGYIDPTHRERKRHTGGQTNQLPNWKSVDQLLEETYNADPHHSPWPYELINAALVDDHEWKNRISATMLNSPCPRSTVLEKLEDYVGTADDLWRAFRGTMTHTLLEQAARPGSVAEVKFIAMVGDEEFSCVPDLITPNGQIWDYKNVARIPAYDYVAGYYAEQLQFNRWGVNNAVRWEKDGEPYDLTLDVRTMKFEHLVILFLGPDEPKALEYMESIEVPTGKGAKYPTKKVRVPGVWSDERVMDVMLPRFNAMRAALDSYPDFPDIAQKVWGGPAEWKCPGWPYCPLRGKCLASRYPNGLKW